MTADPRMRASDQDRERAAQALSQHHAVGRIDAAEFHERLDRVFEAKTIGDLDELTADLPDVDLYPLPTSSLRRTGGSGGLPSSTIAGGTAGALSRRHGRLSPPWLAAWSSWLGVTLLCTVIWLLSGAGYPWPLWVAGPWGAILAAGWIVGR
ncbi:MAG TPA: DUF1707 domain-containing protein [Streptosporangiaceae bacterium]